MSKPSNPYLFKSAANDSLPGRGNPGEPQHNAKPRDKVSPLNSLSTVAKAESSAADAQAIAKQRSLKNESPIGNLVKNVAAVPSAIGEGAAGVVSDVSRGAEDLGQKAFGGDYTEAQMREGYARYKAGDKLEAITDPAMREIVSKMQADPKMAEMHKGVTPDQAVPKAGIDWAQYAPYLAGGGLGGLGGLLLANATTPDGEETSNTKRVLLSLLGGGLGVAGAHAMNGGNFDKITNMFSPGAAAPAK